MQIIIIVVMIIFRLVFYIEHSFLLMYRYFFVLGGCAEYDRMFNSIPGLLVYPLDVYILSQMWQPKISPEIAKCPLESKITLSWEPLMKSLQKYA